MPKKSAAELEDLFDKAAETRTRSPVDMRYISIRGAREHNLKNVDLDIPRDKLVVFTGLSGSGKSSLAFDTIYAEASAVMWKASRPMPASFWK